MKTVIIDYGAGNVFSVQSALARLGVNGFLTNEKNEILSADRVIFPGVGHASSALKQLRETKLDQLIPSLKQPVLGVCLGMQLMCEHTQEGNENGLGVFEEVMVKRFEGTLKIPHMGWNNLKETSKKMQGLEEDVYFVHSYFAPINKYTVAKCNYGHDFSAAMEKNNFFACQFHPEKSGLAGELILKRFLNA